MNLKLISGGLLLCAMSTFAGTIYNFDNITNNNAANAAIGESQLSLDVSSYGTNQIIFTFNNVGTSPASICDIYFDDPKPYDLTFSKFNYQTAGVLFTIGATPKDLPGGGQSFTSSYSYDSDNPVEPNGVNTGESLGLVFNYANNATFASITNNLNSGAMKVGIHVQAMGTNGESESFVSYLKPVTPQASVPEPGSFSLIAMGLFGLIGAGLTRRKK